MVQLKFCLIIVLACLLHMYTYMVTFQRIHHPSFVLKVQHFNCFLHILIFVSRILNVLGQIWSSSHCFWFP
jgi:hypothetical protein